MSTLYLIGTHSLPGMSYLRQIPLLVEIFLEIFLDECIEFLYMS